MFLFAIVLFASCSKDNAADYSRSSNTGSMDEVTAPGTFDWRTSKLVSLDLSTFIENSDNVKVVSVFNTSGDLLLTRRMKVMPGSSMVHLSLPLVNDDLRVVVGGQSFDISIQGTKGILKKGGGGYPSNAPCPCESRMENVTFQYSGASGATLTVWYKAPGNKLALSHTFTNLTTGAIISVDGFDTMGNSGKTPRLKSQTFLSLDNGANTWNVHTSCSEYILGNVYGPFTVIAFTDGHGRTCSQSCIDTDGDGCCDTVDAFPNDPTLCDVVYNPGKNTFASFAYEDLWPTTGDYDFNDMVINRNTALFLDPNGEVIEAQHSFELMAAGAGQRNGFGFSMPYFTPGDVSMVTSTYATPQNYHSVDAKGLELGQSKAVVIVFENWKDIAVLTQQGQFFNTSHDGGLGYSDSIVVNVKFANPQNVLEALVIDPFLIKDGADRGRDIEVHLPWYGPTDLMDVSYFNTRSDSSAYPNAGNNFVTANNTPWAIETPAGAFEWVLERRDITSVYFDFAGWASSGTPADWYSNGNRDDLSIF